MDTYNTYDNVSLLHISYHNILLASYSFTICGFYITGMIACESYSTIMIIYNFDTTCLTISGFYYLPDCTRFLFYLAS